MKPSAIIKTSVCLSALLTHCVFAEDWIKVGQSNPEGSNTYQKINALGLSCDFLAITFDGDSILTSCRDEHSADTGLGLYILSKANGSYSKNLLFKLGDASQTSSIEFHSPKTISNHVKPKPPYDIDRRIILIDVKDEGACYATEVFKLEGGEFKHMGTVEFSTISYTMNPDTPVYETTMECLSRYSRVSSQENETRLTFSAPQIYEMNSINGTFSSLKESELTYRLSASKLTLIK